MPETFPQSGILTVILHVPPSILQGSQKLRAALIAVRLQVFRKVMSNTFFPNQKTFPPFLHSPHSDNARSLLQTHLPAYHALMKFLPCILTNI